MVSFFDEGDVGVRLRILQTHRVTCWLSRQQVPRTYGELFTQL
jgi:hypothetical protein